MAKECSNTSCTKESCEGCSSRPAKNDFRARMNQDSNIKKVIGVISGKGGVGKSLITASFANQLAAQGFKVGILDADITGPSIPRMYGIKEAAMASEKGIEPRTAENGIKIMSINLLLKHEDDPVIWRGPVIANMVKQFWTDVIWGELDFLLVDMPPGTGDVPLTVFQSLPVDGVVVVTSPQDLVKMIVKKSGEDGGNDENSGSWRGGKLQLRGMSGLREKDFHLWRKPDRSGGGRISASRAG